LRNVSAAITTSAEDACTVTVGSGGPALQYGLAQLDVNTPRSTAKVPTGRPANVLLQVVAAPDPGMSRSQSCEACLAFVLVLRR